MSLGEWGVIKSGVMERGCVRSTVLSS
jgi:hypothetical protein